ncbi:MAG: septal ring lytic transglycosylase RlpA family protein [SAR324 cluster bacterium]|nr:septal ring lytic transglycosylase RlpA family protein [SAR324 cluster bacterium]
MNLKKYILFSIAPLLLSCAANKPNPNAGFYKPENIKNANYNSKQTVSKAATKSLIKPINPSKNKNLKENERKYVQNRFLVATTKAQEKSIAAYPPIFGEASWYGPGFHGKKTANGETYNENSLTAAHRTLPLGSTVKVINLANNKSVVVRINDRGPFVNNRVLDGSKRVAELLDYKQKGVARVKIIILKKPIRRIATTAPTTNKKASLRQIVTAKAPTKNVSLQDGYVVQVGSFSHKKNANDLKISLTGQYKNLIFSINHSYQNYFQVFAGPFVNKREAQNIANLFNKSGIANFVKSYNNI